MVGVILHTCEELTCNDSLVKGHFFHQGFQVSGELRLEIH